MSSTAVQDQLGQVLVDFSKNGTFPEEESTSAAYLQSSALPHALAALNSAKEDLESEIRNISHESAPDVDKWIAHAKSIQDDIEKSRKLANKIVRQAEEDEERLEGLQENETYVEFLTREVVFNNELLTALKALQGIENRLVEVEEQASDRKILDALNNLDEASKSLAELPLEKNTVRAVRLLESKCGDLRNALHDQFLGIWNTLIDVNKPKHTVIINKQHSNATLDHAIAALQKSNQLEKSSKDLWEKLDSVIMKPRTDLQSKSIPRIQIQNNELSLGMDSADISIKSLFTDLNQVIQFLIEHLPSEIIMLLSKEMMPVLNDRILTEWLENAIPSSLQDMAAYQDVLTLVNDFASQLDAIQWPGSDTFHEWVSTAPKIWLSKRRETELDWTRYQLSLGLGTPQPAERSEKRMVEREEGNQIATNSNLVPQDWDAAWESGGEDEPQESSKDKKSKNVLAGTASTTDPAEDQIDDAADAWGWGDEDSPAEAEPPETDKLPVDHDMTPATREIILSEKYWTSSLPQPIFKAVVNVFDDGATLKKPESAALPVTAAAPGLFGLPTLVLAIYRAVSPYYYAIAPCGNMFLYNDSMWLADNLRKFASDWNSRDDVIRGIYSMVKLESDVNILESFGKRAYTNELNSQRTVISDLLGGAQNFFQQDLQASREIEQTLQNIIHYIRDTAASWDKMLPYSVWASATGSLVNAVATKLITDVFDLSDIGVDEAERIATVLSRVEELDSLFLPKPEHGQRNKEGSNIPMTAQFADKWMKMKFLSEVLQSNLKDVKFLWFESDLSLYFTVDEVIELINLSFEKNPAVRQAVKEITENPNPRGESA